MDIVGLLDQQYFIVLMISHSTFLYSRTSKYQRFCRFSTWILTFRGNLRIESIFRRSFVIPVITWTFCLIYLEIGSLFPGNVPVGCSGCRSLSYFRIFYGSRSIVEYIPILYYRGPSELYRYPRISVHYSDPPLGVGSNSRQAQGWHLVQGIAIYYLLVRISHIIYIETPIQRNAYILVWDSHTK